MSSLLLAKNMLRAIGLLVADGAGGGVRAAEPRQRRRALRRRDGRIGARGPATEPGAALSGLKALNEPGGV
eukprot:8353465-Alexandrium_andersonii.AAC.1